MAPDRAGSLGSRWRRAAIVLAAPFLVAWSDPDFHVRVNHELAPGFTVGGWVQDPSGRRLIYGVRDPGPVPRTRQLFSAAADGSQDVLALTDPMSDSRYILLWEIARQGNRVVVMANLDVDERFELYSFTTDGARVPVKLSPPLPPDEEVSTLFALTPDGSRVLFLTGDTRITHFTLRSVPIDGSEPAVVIHEPEPQISGFLTPRSTADSLHVVYPSRDFRTSKRLHCARVDGSSAPLQISPSFEALDPDEDYLLSSDGKWIVLHSRTVGGSDVFSVKVDGSEPPRSLFFPRSSGRAIQIAAASPQAFQISPDGQHVAGIAGLYHSEIRVAPIDGSAPPVVLKGLNDLYLKHFRFSGGGRLVFRADLRGEPGLFTVPMDGSAPHVRIHGFRRHQAWANKFEVSPAGDVVFDGYLDGSWRLFTVPIDGGTPASQLHPDMVTGGNVYNANSTNGRSFVMSPDGEWLLYLADQEQDEVKELFAVAPDGSPAVRKMNGPLPPGGDVVSHAFARDSRRVFYGVWTSTTRDVYTSVIHDDRGARQPAGEDSPMVSERAVKMGVAGLEQSTVLDDATRRAIDRENALALFPRFADAAAPRAQGAVRSR